MFFFLFNSVALLVAVAFHWLMLSLYSVHSFLSVQNRYTVSLSISLSLFLSLFTFVPLYSIPSIGKCKIQTQHTFLQVIWVFFCVSSPFHIHTFFLYIREKKRSSLTTLTEKSARTKKKRKTQKVIHYSYMRRSHVPVSM